MVTLHHLVREKRRKISRFLLYVVPLLHFYNETVLNEVNSETRNCIIFASEAFPLAHLSKEYAEEYFERVVHALRARILVYTIYGGHINLDVFLLFANHNNCCKI